jgi:hypothetical protein
MLVCKDKQQSLYHHHQRIFKISLASDPGLFPEFTQTQSTHSTQTNDESNRQGKKTEKPRSAHPSHVLAHDHKSFEGSKMAGTASGSSGAIHLRDEEVSTAQ